MIIYIFNTLDFIAKNDPKRFEVITKEGVIAKTDSGIPYLRIKDKI